MFGAADLCEFSPTIQGFLGPKACWLKQKHYASLVTVDHHISSLCRKAFEKNQGHEGRWLKQLSKIAGSLLLLLQTIGSYRLDRTQPTRVMVPMLMEKLG